MLGRFAVTVDTVPVAEASWTRRHAAALVKVLALAPGRRLHREQVIDLVWPEDTLDEAVPKLHKAAHYARRALAVPDAVVLRGDHVALLPGTETTVDVLQFEELARRALADEDVVAARARPRPATAASCCPQDRYDDWAEERREQLRLRHLDLLRLDGRWDELVELDAGDEARPRRAHAAPRRQRRPPRRPPAVRAPRQGPPARARRRPGTRRGRAARPPARRPRRRAPSPPDELVGRDRELAVAERALEAAAAGRSRTLIISGPAGTGKSSMLAALTRRARELGLRIGQGTSAPVEGAWPYAPVVEAMADLCRRHPTLLDGLADQHREEIDRVLAGEETVVVGRELAPAPVRGHGRAGPPRRGDERAAADLRRRPRRRRLQPAPAALPRPGDARRPRVPRPHPPAEPR